MIDDVVYMQRHGKVETRVIYIDSNERTNLVDDSDNDFTISFDEPIRNVVGVKIIDSSIPAAMYTVDDHNNRFRIFAFGFDKQDPECDVAHSHFYAQCFLDFMAEELNWADETSDADAVLVVRDFRSRPLPDLTAVLAPEPLVTNGEPYAITVLGPFDPEPPAAVVRTMTDRESRRFRVAFHMDDGSGVSHKAFKRVYTVANGFYTRITTFLSITDTGVGPRSALIANGDLPFLVGTSTPPERLSTLDILTYPWAVALAEPDITGTALVAFDTTSSIASVVGFNRPVNSITCMGRQMSTNVAPGGAAPGPYIRTGDFMNLSGERYITLRCPQIETAAYVGMGRRSQRGVALFKLGPPGNIRSESADYVNVIASRFHPIAKLDRLSLRYERGASGELFNFRGSSPLLIVAMDVIVNKPDMDEFKESTLNPEYDVDFRAYVINRMAQDAMLEAEATDSAPMAPERVARAIGQHSTAYDRY